MKKVFLSIFIGFAVLNSLALAETNQKMKIVATYSILGDVVKNVAGDKVELTVLVGPDGDAHIFEPTPKESIVLSRADVIFENGLHFEHWIDHLYEASGSKARRVVVTDGMKLIVLATHERINDKRSSTDVDPHVWQDVRNMMLITQQVRDSLIAVDTVNAAYYKENARKYLAELNDLENWIRETLKNIPDEKRKLITSHDALGYFAKRYSFEVVGTAIPSATTEAEDPSAAHIAQLLGLVKSSGVKALFAENIHNAKLIEMLSKEAGVVLAPRLYTDALGAAGSDGDTYVRMMRHNVKIIAEYLK